jgi:hypothetical protein
MINALGSDRSCMRAPYPCSKRMKSSAPAAHLNPPHHNSIVCPWLLIPRIFKIKHLRRRRQDSQPMHFDAYRSLVTGTAVCFTSETASCSYFRETAFRLGQAQRESDRNGNGNTAELLVWMCEQNRGRGKGLQRMRHAGVRLQ